MRAIIPAAGKGTRLHLSGNDKPKVMQLALGKPLLETVLHETAFISPEDTYIVVGYKKDDVMGYFGDKYHYIEQKEQLGTGHAVRVCEDAFRDYDGTVLVTFGDMPLFRRECLEKLCREHEMSGADCTLLTAINDDLPYWARIIRDGEGSFAAIVEAKDATPEQTRIRELFAGVLVFNSRSLFSVLPDVGCRNKQHEYYLTEVPQLMRQRGMKIETFMTDDGDDLRGVNTPEDLRICEEIMKKRKNALLI